VTSAAGQSGELKAMQAQIATIDRDDVSRLADAAGARVVIIEA
jgi:hypothetical protein